MMVCGNLDQMESKHVKIEDLQVKNRKMKGVVNQYKFTSEKQKNEVKIPLCQIKTNENVQESRKLPLQPD